MSKWWPYKGPGQIFLELEDIITKKNIMWLACNVLEKAIACAWLWDNSLFGYHVSHLDCKNFWNLVVVVPISREGIWILFPITQWRLVVFQIRSHCYYSITHLMIQVTRERALRNWVFDETAGNIHREFGSGYPGGEITITAFYY